MANFERFRRDVPAFASDPYITIQKRGVISLNRAAFGALGAPQAVELLYDRTARVVGLRAADPRADDAYQVRATAPGGPFVISAIAFTKHYGIDTSAAHRWLGFVDNGVLCVDLTTPGTPVTSNRAHRPAPDAAPLDGSDVARSRRVDGSDVAR